MHFDGLRGLDLIIHAHRSRARIGAEQGEEEMNARHSSRDTEGTEGVDPYGAPQDDGLTEAVHELLGDRGEPQ